MLTRDQYAAIGHLALGINTIEFSVETFTANILGRPNLSLARVLVSEGSIGYKLTRLTKLLSTLNKQRPDITDNVKALEQWIAYARELIALRNQYVHARINDAYSDGSTLLFSRDQPIECDAGKINFMVTEVARLIVNIQKLYDELQDALEHPPVPS